MPTFSTVTLPDGARLAYEVLGSEWQGQRQPIVLIGGVSSLRGDWDRLAASLALQRPVLIYDHRGMGDSTYSTQNKDDPISIESLARDLLFLLQSLHWKEISICGFSMGGVVTQQLLLLPYLPLNPTPLPFTVTHVFLTGTFPEMWKEKGYGLKFDLSPLPGPGPLTEEQKKARAKPVTESTFDAAWLADPKNQERFEWWLERMIHGRPIQTILKQGRAVRDMNFTGLHSRLSKDIQFLVIHGERDAVVPFSSGQKLLQLIPWARFVEVGNTPGQIPNLAFGHFWFEYFDVRVWTDVIEKFLATKDSNSNQHQARL